MATRTPLELQPVSLTRIDGQEGAEGAAAFRRYSTPVGWAYSVTSILGATMSPEAKERLESWLQRPTAARDSLCARLRGTWTHSELEHHLWPRQTSHRTPRPRRIPHLHRQFAEPWATPAKEWADAHVHSLLAQEHMVYHPAGMAGTLDALGWLYDSCELTLLDWKTATKPKPLELLEESYLPQLAAYRAGLHHLHPELGVIRRAQCVVFLPGQQPQIAHLSEADLDHYERVFFERLEAFQRLIA